MIFRSFRCQAYDEDSEGGVVRSFLSADLSVSCDGGPEHARIKLLAYILMGLWPVGLVLLYVALLILVGPRLRARTPDALTRQTSFLHAEYKVEYYYWEVVELLRRTTLVGYVLLIPVEQAFARIVVGLLVSLAYLICLLATKPYVRAVDDYLATGCSSILVFVFLGAMIIRIHNQITESYSMAVAADILVFQDTQLTSLLIALCFAVLVVLVLVLAVEIRRARRAVYARWESDHSIVAPQRLKPGQYHTFISHNWRSAQDQARAMKQLLVALAPGLKVWLDVDDMRSKAGTSATNTANFEFVIDCAKSMCAATCANQALGMRLECRTACFLFFRICILAGEFRDDSAVSCYFLSGGCMKEIRRAVQTSTPIIFVLETDPTHNGIKCSCPRYFLP